MVNFVPVTSSWKMSRGPNLFRDFGNDWDRSVISVPSILEFLLRLNPPCPWSLFCLFVMMLQISSKSSNSCIPLVQYWYTTSNSPSLYVSLNTFSSKGKTRKNEYIEQHCQSGFWCACHGLPLWSRWHRLLGFARSLPSYHIDMHWLHGKAESRRNTFARKAKFSRTAVRCYLLRSKGIAIWVHKL